MKIRIDGLMVLVLALVGGLGFLWFKKGDIKAAALDAVDKVNPASHNNIVYSAAEELGIITNEPGGWEDKTIGAFELLNPWASDTSKRYAREVWGLDP